jgi:transcriptional regulator with XRE-family HTH domain
MTLQEKLQYARKKCGLTRKQVMFRTGIKTGDIRGFEFGITEPKYSELCQLAECYHITTEFLMSPDEPKETTFLYYKL